MRVRFFTPLAGLLTLAFLVAGCDTAGLDLDGEFIATAEGDVEGPFEGEARWTIFGEDTEDPRFALFFFRGDLSDIEDDEYTYLYFYRPGRRPGVSTYPINSDGDTGQNAFSGSYADLVDADGANASGPVLTATGGILALTAFENSVLSGSFRFEGEGAFLPNTSESITATINGTFEAYYIRPNEVDELEIEFDFN